jgi:hypothetical protein
MKSIIWEEKFLDLGNYKTEKNEYVGFYYIKENNKIYIKGLISLIENMEWDELKKYSLIYYNLLKYENIGKK